MTRQIIALIVLAKILNVNKNAAFKEDVEQFMNAKFNKYNNLIIHQ